MIRGLIAVAWYGIQTYLASSALIIVVLRFFPQMAVYAEPHFAGLSYLGWFGFLSLWVVAAGGAIRRPARLSRRLAGGMEVGRHSRAAGQA